MSDGSRAWGGDLNRDLAQRPPATVSQRVLGGPPLAVVARLVLASLLVGAVMMWLRIEPVDVLVAVANAVHHLWAMGFLAAGQIGRYLLAGAAIVVPLWVVARILSFRSPR